MALEEEIETFEGRVNNSLDEAPKKATLDKVLQSLYYELYTPFITDPDEFLDAGDVQVELFPHLALRKYQLYLRHANKGTYPEFLAYICMEEAYERMGHHKKALEMRKTVYRLSIMHLVCDVGHLLLEDSDNEKIFSLIKTVYGDLRDFWSEVISQHKKSGLSERPHFGRSSIFNSYGKLVLREVLQRYSNEDPQEADPILRRVKEEFEEIHPDSEFLRGYDLSSYLEWTKNSGMCATYD